jgi:hypothetical protein
LYDVVSEPAIDASRLTVKATNSGAVVYVKAAQVGTYKITLHAQSGNAHESAIVALTAYKKPVISDLSRTVTLNPGISDTLLFTVKSDPTDSVKIQLINSSSFKSGVISILSGTSAESLKTDITLYFYQLNTSNSLI